jgi:hypothetical protein
MSALAADHRNDVVATIVALVFGIIGKILERKKFLFVDIHIFFLWKKFTFENSSILFIFLGSKAIDGEIKPRELSVIDPVGK